MNLLALLKLVPARAWEALAVLLAIAVFGAYMFYRGGVGPRAELAAVRVQYSDFVSQVKLLGDAAKKAAADKEKADQLAKEKADAQYAQTLKDVNVRWAADRAERDRLRKQLSDSRRGTVPQVSIGAGLSCGSTSDATISAAVSGYIEAARRAFDDCRAAATDFRNSVALQLEQAEVNTAALSCGVTWASQIR